jgi:hypothetical protein
LRRDKAAPRQDPPNRRHDRHRRPAAASWNLARQVCRDRFRPRVQAQLGQLLTLPNDHFLGVGVHRVRAVMRPPRPGLERRRTFALIPLHQLLHPVAGDPVIAGHLGPRPTFNNDSGDDQLRPSHSAPPDKEVSTMSPDSCQLCRASSHPWLHRLELSPNLIQTLDAEFCGRAAK